MTNPVAVDVWSDVACPWCLLGNAHLQQASRRSGIPVDVSWHSFQLSPDLERPVPVQDYLVAKYGDADRIAQGHERLKAMGAAVGLEYRFDRAVAANTFDAHRLHHFAKTKDLGNVVMEALLRAQHTDGQDVSDHAVLQRIGETSGLDPDDVADLLAGDAHAEDVRADLDAARRIGVTGVPFFVLDRHLALSGAQPVQVFEDALRTAADPPPAAP